MLHAPIKTTSSHKMDGISVASSIVSLGTSFVFCGFAFFLLYKYFNKKVDGESEKSDSLFNVMKDSNSKQTDMILSTQNDIKKALTELSESNKKQNATLEGIKEALEPSTLTMLNNIADAYFDLAKENVSRMIIQLRGENNLDKKEATITKIRDRVKVLHDERNDALSCFMFRGRRLSDFTREEWIARVSKVVEYELYSEKVSDGRAWATIDNLYKGIKTEFLRNATNQ